jgi:hypothetical protein
MIKRYNQFVNEKLNEKLNENLKDEEEDLGFAKHDGGFDGDDSEEDLGFAKHDGGFDGDDSEEDLGFAKHDGGFDGDDSEEEEEGGDLYRAKMKELASKLSTDVMDNNTIDYNGKQIIFPSETEMYHVDRKKFKTADEVLNYLKSETQLQESKSYRKTRLNKRK